MANDAAEVAMATTGGFPDKYIGLMLALSSSLALGSSPILTKKGLRGAEAENGGGLASENYSYLTNKIWWCGMALMVIGEVANFGGYLFAPPIMVAPLGSLSVIVGAILAAFFLGETLDRIGISGISLCLVGSLIIVLHAPDDKPLNNIDDVLRYAGQPGFMFYCFLSLVACLYLVFYLAPIRGRQTPLIYVTICSLSGSVSVCAVKGLGVGVKLTIAGDNQLWTGSFWILALTVVGCILVQLNYLNKALEVFPTNKVNPIYFVMFSGCTIIASIILFQGLYESSAVDNVSLLAGFYITSLGVFLLNSSSGSEKYEERVPKSPMRDSIAMGRTHLLAQATSDDDDDLDDGPERPSWSERERPRPLPSSPNRTPRPQRI